MALKDKSKEVSENMQITKPEDFLKLHQGIYLDSNSFRKV